MTISARGGSWPKRVDLGPRGDGRREVRLEKHKRTISASSASGPKWMDLGRSHVERKERVSNGWIWGCPG